MNQLPNDIIRNPKLLNLKEIQYIKKSIGGGSKSKKGFKWLLLKWGYFKTSCKVIMIDIIYKIYSMYIT